MRRRTFSREKAILFPRPTLAGFSPKTEWVSRRAARQPERHRARDHHTPINTAPVDGSDHVEIRDVCATGVRYRCSKRTTSFPRPTPATLSPGMKPASRRGPDVPLGNPSGTVIATIARAPMERAGYEFRGEARPVPRNIQRGSAHSSRDGL